MDNMFDMGEVGRRISAARKDKNMTQMELADRLNRSEERSCRERV